MVEYDEKMRQKLMDEYSRKMGNAKVIKDQHHDYKMQCLKRIQQEMLEGELVKRQVLEEIEKEHQRELERKRRQADQRDQFKQANEDMLTYNAELKKKEIVEEAKIGEYARKRDAMEQLRKDKEEQKFSDKQKTRQALIDTQIANLAKIKNKEDEILNK